MGLDLARIKQRADEGGFSGSRFKPKKAPNQNLIRVFKFTHKVTPEDVKSGLYVKDKLGKTVEEFDRQVKMQFGFREKKAPIIATPQTLAKYDSLKNSSNENNQKASEAIKPSTKYLMNVVDMDEKPRKMRHWAAPATAYNDILAIVMNPEFGEAVLGPDGRDFIITFDKDKPATEMYKVQLRDKAKSSRMDPKLQEKVLDFYTTKGLTEVGLVAKAKTDAGPAQEEEETEEQETEEVTEETGTEESTEEVAEETAEETTEESSEETSEETEEEPSEEESEPEPEEEAPKKAPAKKVVKKGRK